MHAWNTPSWCPDVGAFLYKHVHSLHHKSRNPTSFSGISMHPVESTIFYSTMLIAALCGAHPIVILHAKFYNTSAAMAGHDGFGDPSSGGHMHWLHHHKITCNYGGNFIPLDHIFGSFAADEEDFIKKGFGSKVKADKAKQT